MVSNEVISSEELSRTKSARCSPCLDSIYFPFSFSFSSSFSFDRLCATTHSTHANMSFGFSPSDIIAAVALAYKIYEKCFTRAQGAGA